MSPAPTAPTRPAPGRFRLAALLHGLLAAGFAAGFVSSVSTAVQIVSDGGEDVVDRALGYALLGPPLWTLLGTVLFGWGAYHVRRGRRTEQFRRFHVGAVQLAGVVAAGCVGLALLLAATGGLQGMGAIALVPLTFGVGAAAVVAAPCGLLAMLLRPPAGAPPRPASRRTVARRGP